MKKVTKLQVNKWYGKNCVSADHLNELAKSGVIKREQIGIREGFDWIIRTFKFSTHYGVELAVINKEDGWGFSSQAYGIEIPVSTLKNPKKLQNDMAIFRKDHEIFSKCSALKMIAYKQHGILAFV